MASNIETLKQHEQSKKWKALQSLGRRFVSEKASRDRMQKFKGDLSEVGSFLFT